MIKRAAPLLVAGLAFAGVLSIRGPETQESFLPPNDMRIATASADDKGITKEQFEQVMDRGQEIYGPIIAARGGKLVINRLWEDETVNASAQRMGSDYVLNMYGGLARHETITQDGMAL